MCAYFLVTMKVIPLYVKFVSKNRRTSLFLNNKNFQSVFVRNTMYIVCGSNKKERRE